MSGRDELRFDVGSRLGKAKRTGMGGAVIPARLGRTGVLTYRNPDGSTRRELRLDSEVFDAQSLATLEHAAVIDIADHNKLHGADGWRKVARGHAANVARDGHFIAGNLVVQDKETLDAIDRGERTEVSCGYRCRLDFTPGTTAAGEAYDCVQRDIRYDHVSLCPPGRGRSGPEVSLRLDGVDVYGGAAVARFDDGMGTSKEEIMGKELEEAYANLDATMAARDHAMRVAGMSPAQREAHERRNLDAKGAGAAKSGKGVLYRALRDQLRVRLGDKSITRGDVKRLAKTGDVGSLGIGELRSRIAQTRAARDATRAAAAIATSAPAAAAPAVPRADADDEAAIAAATEALIKRRDQAAANAWKAGR